MVGGRLYLWLRNVHNARLAWSDDRGQTWTQAPWRFEVSFGCPAFVNEGRDHAGAPDRFVYVVSHDSDSAYEAADRMVLARVPAAEVNNRGAYAFFAGHDAAGRPSWTPDIANRTAIFTRPGGCYRSGMTHNRGLGRYLWCQSRPGNDPRRGGGFGVYEAPAPWGPWATVFDTDAWDVGPGESQSFPAKWLSEDGTTVTLVFSGDDAFSVRQARLIRAPSGPNGGP